MNTKKLKQLVLDLAIHGKLVPQDPNDEPASELLKRIQADVETHGRASNKSKGKKSAVSSVDLDEVPFEVPEGWCWTRLGDCFFMQAGKNVKAEDISEEQTECAQYRCFGGNGLRGYVNSYNHNGRFPIIGRQGALCGNVNFAEGEFYATEHAVPVHTFAGTDPMWAYHFLKVLNLNQYATATAQPGLSVKVIEEVLIPLPPLAEQHRIVAEIEKWFAVIDQLEKNEADLKKSIEQTKKKVLDLAIRGKLVAQNPEDEPAGELLKRIKAGRASKNAKGKKASAQEVELDEGAFEIPDNWTWCSITDVAVDDLGKTLDREKNKGAFNPYLRSANVFWGRFDFSDLKEMKFEDSELEFYSLKKGDLMVCEGGDIGRSAVWEDERPMFFQNALHRIRFNNGMNPYFFLYVLQHYKNTNVLEDFSQGVTIKHLTKSSLSKIPFPLPPLAEQKRIVEKIEEVFGVLERIEGMMC